MTARAARRTRSPLVVTGTTDRFQRKSVNIRSVLVQKLRYKKASLQRLKKEIQRMESALRVLSRK